MPACTLMALLAVALVVVAHAGPARADTPATSVGSPAVTAEGAYVAWSSYDALGDAYELMVLGPEGVRPAGLPARPAPLDVDLGPGPDGSVWAVYADCDSGCGVRRYDLASGADGPIGPGRPVSCAVSHPTVHRAMLAYVRTCAGRDVIVETTVAGGPERLIRPLLDRPAAEAPPELELTAAGLLTSELGPCPDCNAASTLRLIGPRGRTRSLASVPLVEGGTPGRLTALRLEGTDIVAVAAAQFSDGTAALIRTDQRGRRLFSARLAPTAAGVVRSASLRGRHAIVARGPWLPGSAFGACVPVRLQPAVCSVGTEPVPALQRTPFCDPVTNGRSIGVCDPRPPRRYTGRVRGGGALTARYFRRSRRVQLLLPALRLDCDGAVGEQPPGIAGGRVRHGRFAAARDPSGTAVRGRITRRHVDGRVDVETRLRLGGRTRRCQAHRRFHATARDGSA
jgi:hypothetical protein